MVDRYFFDMLMELERSNLSTDRYRRIVQFTLPQPLVVFLLDTPDSLLHERRGFMRRESFRKKEIYLHMAHSYHFIVIDTSLDLNDNQKRIRDITMAKMAAISGKTGGFLEYFNGL